VDPVSHALQQWHQVTAEVIRHAGGHSEIAQFMEETITAAGLQPLRQHAYMSARGPHEAAQVLIGARDTLGVMRKAIVAHTIATDAEVDALLRALAEDQSTTYRTFLAPLYVEMIARVP
jgi:hypothetical protein